jgi:hypothetical protein
VRNLGRIAVWNKRKIIFAIAMAIWIADSSLFIIGKYLLLITREFVCIPGAIIATIRVNIQFRRFWSRFAYLKTVDPR